MQGVNLSASFSIKPCTGGAYDNPADINFGKMVQTESDAYGPT